MNPHVEGREVNSVDYFRRCILEGRWEDVLQLYKNNGDFHKIKINESRGTALHVAVNDGKVELVNSLVGAITEHEGMGLRRDSALRSTNKRGDTPLHIAATRGFTGICKCIIGEHGERKDLIKVENDMWETPLSRAVFTCQTKTFVYLHHVSKDLDVPHVSKKRNQRPGESPQYDSILHCAIRGEFLDLAIIITHSCPQLLENIAGIIRATSGDCARYFPEDISYMETPQPTAFQILATKPSAFKSGSGLSWWKQIIYYCIPVESLDADNAIKSYMAKVDKFEDLEHKVTILSENGVKKTHTFVVPNCATFVQFVKRIVRLAFKGLSLSRLGVTVKDLKAIKKIKQNHKWSGQLLNVFIEEAPYDWYKEDGGAFLAAAENGIVEIVNEFRSKIPSMVPQTNDHDENVLHVAVKNRQSTVVEELQKNLDKKLFDSLILDVDGSENTVLHLAAYTGKGERTWQIAGTAMQMMWDIKWYQYIKDLVPDHFTFRKNSEDKTPWDIFEEKHKDLMKESSEWLKETSNSCSVVAALIAGVSFATSSTVPGGTEHGKPTFEDQSAFDIFAIASLIGLSFSVMALIMFLAILTSRKQAEDFCKSLPLKLLLGLTSLFVSITSLLLSFCAAHFFVLKDKYKNILLPIYGATCLPVTFYAMMHFPLYVDLIRAIFKKVPQRAKK